MRKTKLKDWLYPNLGFTRHSQLKQCSICERLDQQNRFENPETEQHKNSQLIFDKRAKAIQWKKDKTLQQMVLGPLDINMQKKNLEMFKSKL